MKGISDKVAARLRNILHERDTPGEPSRELRTLVDEGPMGSLGPYQLEGVIGAGGMGTVYRAVDRVTRQPVAVKVPHAGDFPFSGRFERESELANALGQLGDAPYLDHGVTSSGTPFMAMPLLEGRALDAHLAASGGLPASEALRIGERVAHVLAGLHARGLIHRDVKPGNVFVDEKDAVWLVDHGLTGGPQTVPGAGTVAYAAPEQLAGRALAPSADVYALGLVILEMLRGEPVHAGGATPPGGSSRRTDDALQAVTDLELRALLASMLEGDADERPRDGGCVARALARLRTRGALATASLAWRERGLWGALPFVGRDRELAVLAAAVEAHGVATVAGPSGIGKSRLLWAWWRAFAPPRARLAWPDVSLSPHPRGPGELMRSWLEAVAGLRGGELEAVRRDALHELALAMAGPGTATKLVSRRPDVFLEGALGVLGAVAEDGGLVLIAEHDRAPDRESQGALVELRRRHGTAVTILAEVSAPRAGALCVEPLGADALEELAATAPPDVDATRGLARASGSPLALQLHALAEGDTPELATAAALRELDPYAAWLLRLASLAGVTFGARELLAVAGASDGPIVRDGLARLAARSWVIDLARDVGAVSGTYRFTHELVAGVARSTWSGSERALGSTLLGRGTGVTQRAGATSGG